MTGISLYQSGHLFVAAIRVLEHLNKVPPTVEQVASMIGLALEQAGRISRRLIELGIVGEIKSGSELRLAINDHLALEQLPRTSNTAGLEKELEKFHAKRRQINTEIETLKQQQEKKKQDLFAEIEKKLKKNLSD